MRDLFKLKCNRCGSEITILDCGYTEPENSFNIDIWVDDDGRTSILCECGNEIKLK